MSGRAAPYNASEHLLVVARTHRPDALNNFRMYTGGWNLSSTSYLASAGFVGMPLFVISLIWIFMGFTFMIVVTCMYFCWKDNLKSEPDFGRFGNYTTLLLVIAFTVITISGCGALFTGQEELHSDLSQVFNYLTTQVAQAANDSVQAVPPTAVPDATHAAEVLENATSSISITVHQTLDQIFVAIGWLGVIGLWYLGGLFLLVYAVFGDTCAAIDEWTRNPRNGTAFDIIVRCELNHTKPPRGRRHTSMGELPARDEDEMSLPEYKPLIDLSHLPQAQALPLAPLPTSKPPPTGKDAPGEEETPFPEYKALNESSTTDDDRDDPNDASPRKREAWAQLTVQRKDAASEKESCTILRSAFVPILNTISKYNCPSIIRKALWVPLAMVTVSGGSMCTICLWIVITRRSTMRLRKMVPVDDQLPFYAYVFQEVSAAPPPPAPQKMTQYVEYPSSSSNNYSNNSNNNAGAGAAANLNSYNARSRRSAHVYRNPVDMARSADGSREAKGKQ